MFSRLKGSYAEEMANLKQAIRDLWNGLTNPLPVVSENFESQVLESDQNERKFGYAVVLLVFLGFGGWAAFAPLESAALGRGTVQVEGNRKPVQHLEGGIVSEVYVANGDYVEESEVLVQLDKKQLAAQKSIIEGRRWAKQAAVSRLESERDGFQEVNFLSALLEQEDQRARTAIKNENALFKARYVDREGEISVIERRISQLNEQISGNEAVRIAKESVASSLETEVTDLNELLKEGYVDKQRIRTLERSLAQTLGEIADLRATAAAIRVTIEEAELQILQINKRFVNQVVDSLTRAQEELYDLDQQFMAISDRVSRSTVRSPVSGYVLALSANTAGAVIAPGQEIMSIVPDVGRLIVDAELSPMDIDRIRIGQEAEVRFAVFKDAYTITGTLINVSADSLINEKTGASYFEAKVALQEDDLELLGEDKLVPGMPADVLIKTGNRTLLGYVTSPLQRMFENSLIED